jgi:lipoprotein LprG
MSLRAAVPIGAVALALSFVMAGTTGCSQDGGAGDGDPDTVLKAAQDKLDATSGVRLQLETPGLPDGVAGVAGADGIATHQPAFKGEIDIVYSGFTGTVPVTSVDGTVYAVLPFTLDYAEIDPAEYGAPDPATLMDPESGVSSWLTAATDMEKGDQVRDGDDVLTSYDGTLAGSIVAAAIPSADEEAEFDASFSIDEDGRLRTASVSGPFYAGEPELTYDITFTEYGTDEEISAP